MTSSQLRWPASVAGLCVVLLAPLFIVDVPPLLDYPNHLARIFVLAALPHDPVLARFYAPHWSVIPNLALDLVGPPLLRILPVYAAGRLLIALAVLLPVLGTIACHTALGGRWWALAVGLLAYNLTLLSGFLNFQIAIGLALLLAAAWLRWRDTSPASAILLAAAGAPILFACHLMGVAFFGALLAGAELSHSAREWPRRLAVLAVVFAAPVALYALSDLRQLGGDAQFMPPVPKLLQLATSFTNYSAPLDAVTAALAIGLPALCLLLRWGRVPPQPAIASVLLLIAFLVAPFAWKGTYALDTRFAVMLGFMLFAGFIPTGWPPWFTRMAALALALLFAARMALLITACAAYARDVADVRTVLTPVQPGQAVYVAEASATEARGSAWWRRLSNGARIDQHLGALVLIEHRAWWPFEFDNPSQQPLETRQPYRGLADRVGRLPDPAQANIADLCGFDYVLLMEADSVPPLPEKRLRLLRQSGFAALYAITKCQEDP